MNISIGLLLRSIAVPGTVAVVACLPSDLLNVVTLQDPSRRADGPRGPVDNPAGRCETRLTGPPGRRRTRPRSDEVLVPAN